MEYEEWKAILAPYNNAVEELKVKFKNIRKEFLEKGDYSPIEFVTGRTKKIASIVAKVKKINATDIEKDIEDIAGIRIMCQFVEDIYTIVELIKNRTDMIVVHEKDYIKNYKESGYRSYHVIIKYPINTVSGSKEVLCEIQIRTLAMNFWATIEHSLKYKYDHYIPDTLAIRLRRAADAAFLLDQEMGEIREDIMNAQAMYRMRELAVKDVLDRIQEVRELGFTNSSIQYQRRLDMIQNSMEDVKEVLELKKEIGEKLEEFKNQKIKE
ncbi:GTP pyrophosphokinase family protein [Peptacetobacter hominis]|uniref:GTP pyrophosphokinase family protein n=1 Tax=Peptacetobacter hominis TaxID=2743610 RepID=A0A544QT25_9FIRM|nr:GTP pyrophosphokinase family protein [Peptacetobacter hominis]TQQ83180.1 GTP pyrophosphokinase family protein [Peptacetobacter hominis]